MRLAVFGYGFSARALAGRLAPLGWSISATARTEEAADAMATEGMSPIRLDDAGALGDCLARADAVLITAPPGSEGCPGLKAIRPHLLRMAPAWVGYLSTTGVYGDRQGGWVRETSRLAAQSLEGARRAGAERDWRDTALPTHVFRLPGIYGPGRSAFDRLRAGRARRIAAPGQVFSRIHVEDLASALVASLGRPRPGAVYNLCDDEPAANSEVVAFAAGLLGIPPPPEIALADADMSPSALRFYGESKRVANARAKSELGWRPAFPTYRQGLRAVLEAGG